MKVFIWILAVLLVLGLVTSLISPSIMPGSSSSSGGSSGGGVKPPDDEENPPFDSEDENVEPEYSTLYSGTPDFSKKIYTPSHSNVPSYYCSTADFSLSDSNSSFIRNNESSEFYGENMIHFNLPNKTFGIYEYELSFTTVGIPNGMDIYLKSPGYLNKVPLFELSPAVLRMGVNFESDSCYSFKLRLVFDFFSDEVAVYLSGVNQELTLSTVSIESFRTYYDSSSSSTVYTKNFPVILRFQIPKGRVSADDDFSSISFNSFTYKEVFPVTLVSDEDVKAGTYYSDNKKHSITATYYSDDMVITEDGGFEYAGIQESDSVLSLTVPANSEGVYGFSFNASFGFDRESLSECGELAFFIVQERDNKELLEVSACDPLVIPNYDAGGCTVVGELYYEVIFDFNNDKVYVKSELLNSYYGSSLIGSYELPFSCSGYTEALSENLTFAFVIPSDCALFGFYGVDFSNLEYFYYPTL